MSYAALEERFRKIAGLDHALGILDWDQAVVMPTGSAVERGTALGTLAGIRHQLLTSQEAKLELDAASKEELKPWQQANIREIHRMITRASVLDASLVEESTMAERATEMSWRRAKAENNFKDFAPQFSRLLELKRTAANALAKEFSVSPYEALLDEYETGAKVTELDAFFSTLRESLPEITRVATKKQEQNRLPELPARQFSTGDQKALGEKLMTALGFDFNRGRLDTSHHPFCGGAQGDVRITTRYNESAFESALMGVLHETGHALYEFGLPLEWSTQPVGKARSLGVHESQSLLYEMQLCRSESFLKYAAPIIAESFGTDKNDPRFAMKRLHQNAIQVAPGFIRVDADELHYPLHIVLRYTIEKELIGGKLEVADLPERWNELSQELLGLTTTGRDDLGCLQDIHWPSGSFGYFPVYTLGAAMAAQFFAKFKEETPSFEHEAQLGNFSQLKLWLEQKVWSKASLLSTPELLLQATGSELDPSVYLRHLKQRYC